MSLTAGTAACIFAMIPYITMKYTQVASSSNNLN